MEAIGLASGAGYTIKGTKLVWDVTRTNVDIIINNMRKNMKLEYATWFASGGGCINTPVSGIDTKKSATIQLEADVSNFQFDGILLYKLIPSRPSKPVPSSIYLVLCWKVTAISGLRAYMTLIEHDDYSVSLGSGGVEEHCYQIFCDKPRKLNGAIKCS
jgi:hypothetical protein